MYLNRKHNETKLNLQTNCLNTIFIYINIQLNLICTNLHGGTINNRENKRNTTESEQGTVIKHSRTFPAAFVALFQIRTGTRTFHSIDTIDSDHFAVRRTFANSVHFSSFVDDLAHLFLQICWPIVV